MLVIVGGYGAHETVLNQCFNIENYMRKRLTQIGEVRGTGAQLLY